MTLQDLQEWVGRKKTETDTVELSRVRAMAATLDLDLKVAMGTPLPAGWHWLFFNPMVPARDIGPDGHPARGGFLPPIELPRRMWAGGTIRFEHELQVGDSAARESEITAVEEKSGNQGRLIFVTVRHRISSKSALAIDETQNIVYRGQTSSKSSAGQKPNLDSNQKELLWRREYQPNEVLLFRYSALTFNAHRIHYDKEYAMKEENYPGIVVHGPLTATLLMDAALRGQKEVGSPALLSFSYRGVGALFANETVILEGAREQSGSVSVLARKDDGTLVMTGRACFRS